MNPPNLLTDPARPQHGLMMMTWRPTPVPDEEAFATIRASIDTPASRHEDVSQLRWVGPL